jgi:hypothetical protein
MYTAMQKDIKLIKFEDGSGIEFEATLDGEIIGWYNTRIEAETALDSAAYRRLQQQPVAEEQAETVCNLDALESAYEYANRQDMPQVWRNALEKAYNLLLQSGGITVIYAADGSIAHAYIPSQSEPGKTYLVNGECACQAGQHGKPCAHRAAKRLLNIAVKKQAAWAQPTAAPVLTREDAPDGILHTAYTPERLAAWCREQGIAADEAIDIVLRPATRAWIREQIRIEFD